MSILKGIGSLVDDWLEINPKGKPPYYRHRSAALDLSRRKTPITGTRNFLEGSYAQIDSNWRVAEYPESPSKENWRWKRHLELSSANASPELILERGIVDACGDNWSNQMPTASGLTGPRTGCIDNHMGLDFMPSGSQYAINLFIGNGKTVDYC